jgi:hypothetical protein
VTALPIARRPPGSGPLLKRSKDERSRSYSDVETQSVSAPGTRADEVRCSARGCGTSHREAAQAFRQDRTPWRFSFGGGVTRSRLASGRPVDVVIMTDVTPAMMWRGRARWWRAAARKLAHMGMGWACAGRAPPDIATSDAFEADAPVREVSVYVDPRQGATSGIHARAFSIVSASRTR